MALPFRPLALGLLLAVGPTIAQAQDHAAPTAPAAASKASEPHRGSKTAASPSRALRFQPVLTIAPLPPQKPEAVEPGELVATQRLTPARGVRLTSAPRRDAYGTSGEVLWPARDDEGEYWCRLHERSAFVTNYYCYRDTDGDGVFDGLYENVVMQPPLTFQTRRLGRDEKIGKPVSYAASDAPPALSDIVALRYRGLTSGVIVDDMIRYGLVEFDLVVGQDPRSILALNAYEVQLDEHGRGQLSLPTGHRVIIEDVEVGGRARITVQAGAAAGAESYLFPADGVFGSSRALRD